MKHLNPFVNLEVGIAAVV